MNQLIVTLIVVLLPGITATVICDKITVHSKWSSFKFGVYSIVLGVFCYRVLKLAYYFIDLVCSWSFSPATWSHLLTWNAVTDDNPDVPVIELAMAFVLSIPVSFFAAFTINHKLFNKAAQWMGVSTKYGDENLFSYYLNAKEIDWIYIRDKENEITYQGRIVSSSETDGMQEVVLSEVPVFRYVDSAELSSVPTVYL